MPKNQAKKSNIGRTLGRPSSGRSSRRNFGKAKNPLDEEYSDGINLSACDICGLWGCTGDHIPTGPRGGD